MGLAIYTQSGKCYRWNYGALHRVRYMGYLAKGGRKTYERWHDNYLKEITEADEAYRKAFHAYINLYWHSDCEGKYTLDGVIDDINKPTNGLTTGNSKQLLYELEDIKERLKNSKRVTELDWAIFEDLYEVVEDSVYNCDGVLEFA